MPSPFPGMNPYLEHDDVWHDFHERFLPAVSDFLVPQVRPGFIVRLDRHIYIHERSADERRLIGRGDLAVALTSSQPTSGASSAMVEAPVVCHLPASVDVQHEVFLEIRDRESRELVTVVELLSPTNKKSGPDREQYLGKRLQILQSNVHLVELDFLRGYPRLPLQDLPDCDYYALVSRSDQRPRTGVWPLRLRDRLPVIPIPLRPADRAAQLDLQEVLNRVYDAAAYEDEIYRKQPQPPLHPADAAWAAQFVPQPPVGSRR